MVMLSGKAYVKVGAKRPGHLASEELARRPAGDAPDHLTDNKPLGQRVVAGLGAWLPLRFLGGQPRRDGRPVIQIRGKDRAFEIRQASGVRQQMPDQHALLSSRRELGPVLGDWSI